METSRKENQMHSLQLRINYLNRMLQNPKMENYKVWKYLSNLVTFSIKARCHWVTVKTVIILFQVLSHI